MRISTNQMFQQGLTAILTQQSELAKIQQQIATGQKLSSSSDDPVAAVQILNFERESSLLKQYINNGAAAVDKLSEEESVLKGATNIMQRIRELAVQGLNDTNGQSDRAAIAKEILELNDELLSIANTRDASGNYLFSGFSSNAKPYESIGAAYSGDEGQRTIQIGPSAFVDTNDPGNVIFEGKFTEMVVTDNIGPSSASLNITSTNAFKAISPPVTISYATPDTLTITDGSNTEMITPYLAGQSFELSALNVNFPDLTLQLEGTLTNGDSYSLETQEMPSKTIFSTVNAFANALTNDTVGSNDSPNNGDFLTNLSTVLGKVIDTQAGIGARINVIEQQEEISGNLSLNVQATLSDLKDLDLAEAISRLSSQSTALEAAQQTFVRVQSLNLFNFL